MSVKKIVRKMLGAMGYDITQNWVQGAYSDSLRPSLGGILTEYITLHPAACFLQIGANDGVRQDPIHVWIMKYRPRGILVEPQKLAFERLKSTYSGHDNLTFINAAISSFDERKPFYTLKENYAQEARGTLQKVHSDDRISSFYPGFICKAVGYSGKWQDILDENIVECVSVHSLLKSLGMNSIDILQIDTEGFDYQILSSIDFEQVRPDIICFEYVNLSNSDKRKAIEMLVGLDYRWARHGLDVVAVQKRCALSVVQ